MLEIWNQQNIKSISKLKKKIKMDAQSYELLNQVSNNNVDFENASFARSANGRIATTYDDEGMKILWH